jgi:flagellar hook-length control protein FliK
MSDTSLSLPTSTSPLTSSHPVSETRGVGADASGEEAATSFANLLKDTLKNAEAEARTAPPAGLAGDDGTDADGEADLLDALAADPAQTATDLVSAGLVAPPALQVIDQASGRHEPPQDDSGSDPEGLRRGARAGGSDDEVGLPAAAIAAETTRSGKADGKNLPDALLTADTSPGTSQASAHATPHADFRAHLSAAHKPAAEMAVATPITHPGWADDVGHQITWLAENGNSRAELILTPPHLGRIEISLQIGSDLSSAQFISASPQVREALEQAMPRLREMLAGSGISLGEASVSDDPRSGGQDTSGQRHGRGRADMGSADALAAPAARRGTSLVDLFA